MYLSYLTVDLIIWLDYYIGLLITYFSYCSWISAELSCVPGSKSNPGENWQQDGEMNQMTLPYQAQGSELEPWRSEANTPGLGHAPPPTPPPRPPPPHTHKHTALHLYESQWKHILLLWNWNTKVYLVICYTTITKHVFMGFFSWLYRPPCHWWIKFIFCTNIQALAQRIGDRHLFFY